MISWTQPSILFSREKLLQGSRSMIQPALFDLLSHYNSITGTMSKRPCRQPSASVGSNLFCGRARVR